MLEGLFQPTHLLLILVIALVFFGPKRLPELGKGLGSSIRDFREALSGNKPDDKASTPVTPTPQGVITAPPVAVAAQVQPVQAVSPSAAPAASNPSDVNAA